jgi:hypothetical protein
MLLWAPTYGIFSSMDKAKGGSVIMYNDLPSLGRASVANGSLTTSMNIPSFHSLSPNLDCMILTLHSQDPKTRHSADEKFRPPNLGKGGDFVKYN